MKFERIKSIVPMGNRKAYDLSIKGVHKGYLVNGFLTHNSGGDFRADFCIEDAFATFEDGIKFKKKYPEVAAIAMKLEGQVRGLGQHAAAVVISSEDLRMGKRASLRFGKDKDAMVNWDKYDIEHVGLMKLDVLGLNALTVLNETRKAVKKNHGVDINYEKLSLEDQKCYEEFSAGNNVGCFQVGSLGLRKYCQELGIENFDLLVAASALFRPGTLRCLTGDTEITCWSGKKVRVDEIDKGRPVRSSALPVIGKYKYIKNRVKEVVRTGFKAVYELLDADGDSIKSTAEHRFYVKECAASTSRRNKGEKVWKGGVWKELKEIRPGDKILKINRKMSAAKRGVADRLSVAGESSRFCKDQIPWNKGKRLYPDYVYLPKKQKGAVGKRNLEAWKKSMFGDKSKREKALAKMKATKKAFWADPANREKMSNVMLEYYAEHEHPNSKGINVSKPQRELFEAAKLLFLDAEIEYKFNYEDENGKLRFYHLDVAIPSIKLNLEFDDGEYWHKNPGGREEPRDLILEDAGWRVLRFVQTDYKDFISRMFELCLDNSTKYCEVISIQPKGVRRTYDLVMENQHFPNYIAGDFVVHNSGMTSEFTRRKRGEEKWDFKHPLLEPITKDTYGIILYQEQVMRFMYELGGLPWKTADTVRKVISKSQGVEQFKKFKKLFADGCVARKTLDRKTAEELWDELANFGSYGFNLAHAVEYSLITYWDMFVKTHYPAEFMCASLTYGADAKKEELVEEAIRLGLEIRPPKVGISKSVEWIAREGRLYAPFIEIKGFGAKLAEACSKAKINQEGFFKTISKPKGISDRTMKVLQKVGAFEDMKITEKDSEMMQSLFAFSLGCDPASKFSRLISKISTDALDITPLKEVNFSKIYKDGLFHFGRMTEIKYGYRGKIDTIEKKIGASGLAGSLGGVYGNYKDNTDFCMLVFGSDVYKKKKEQIEHCGGDFILAKCSHPWRTNSIHCDDVWFSNELLTGELHNLNLKLARKNKRFKNAAVEECKECSLYQECSTPVASSMGIYDAMVIGEAPGREEDRQKKGFVGDSGELLWNELKNYHLTRRYFHITNIVKCFPSRTKTPTTKHIAVCSKWLKEEIEKVEPFIILAFGNTALKFFLGQDSGIMAKNATTEWVDKYDAWVCWCIHPASVLYHVENMQLFKGGIKNFADKFRLLGGL